jgi:hypothetical protein
MLQPGEEEDIGEPTPADRPKARGGKRPGAGRPRKGRFGPIGGDREYAKILVSTLMRDETQQPALRARCALAVLMKGTWVKLPVDGAVETDANPEEVPPIAPEENGSC